MRCSSLLCGFSLVSGLVRFLKADLVPSDLIFIGCTVANEIKLGNEEVDEEKNDNNVWLSKDGTTHINCEQT